MSSLDAEYCSNSFGNKLGPEGSVSTYLGKKECPIHNHSEESSGVEVSCIGSSLA